MLVRYGNGRASPLHVFDPRMRVVLGVGFALLTVLLEDWRALGCALAIGLLLTAMARLDRHDMLHGLIHINLFVLMLALFVPISTPGPAAWSLGGVQWSWPGLALAGRIALKANAVLLAARALMLSMEPATLGHACEGLRVPRKLVHIFLFMVRNIDVIWMEYRRLRNAMKLRGFRLGLSLHALRSLGYLLGMLFVRSIDRADRILEAMKCRGFDGRFYVMESFRLRLVDGGFALLFALLLSGLAYLEWA